jgi:hypothetical protein
MWVRPHRALGRPRVMMTCMSFFGDMPHAEPEPRVHHPWDLPVTEFPAVVPAGPLMLGRTERAAVAITGISAYSAGFEIFVTARFRPGAGGASSPGDRMPGGPEAAAPRQSFRLGLQFADGTRGIGQHGEPRPAGDAEPAGPILRTFLGGGGPRSSFWRWWAWPLPPAGPVEFVCEWPALGIPETRAGLDAQLILDAADRSIRLWREQAG